MARCITLSFALVLCALGTLAASSASSSSESNYKVVFSQVIHRHGARTPTNLEEPTSILNKLCGSRGCGMLTRNGEDMLYQLGQWTRARYMNFGSEEVKEEELKGNRQSGLVGEKRVKAIRTDTKTSKSFSSVGPQYYSVSTNYIQNYSYYNPYTIHQRSTSVSRTLQSAAAFVQGLFNSADSSKYPVVRTIDLEDDSLLYVKSIPSFAIAKDATKKEIHEQCGTHTLAALNGSEWISMGNEFGLSEKCNYKSDHGAFCKCSHELYDLAAAYEAEGTFDSNKYPLTYKHWQSGVLQKVKGYYHYDLYHFNTSRHTDRHRGPLGRNVIGEMKKRMDEYIDQIQNGVPADQERGLPVYREYSSHDTTIVVTAGFFGQAWEMRNPGFAEAMTFELLQKDDGESKDDYWVRIVYGQPGQLPNSGHQYTMSYFNMTCRNAITGEYYHTGTGEQLGCPYEDFVSYYDHHVGSSSHGLNCYVDPDYLHKVHCTKTDKKPSLGEKDYYCRWYRTVCPEYGCPSGSYLKFPDLECKTSLK